MEKSLPNEIKRWKTELLDFKLTKHRQLDALNEDPGFGWPHSVHHHEALVSPRVSDLNVSDDQRTVPGPQLLLGNLHPPLELLRLPLFLATLLEHGVGRGRPLDVAGRRGRRPQALLPAAGKDRLVPHPGGDGQEVGGGGEGRGLWKNRQRKQSLVSDPTFQTMALYDSRVSFVRVNFRLLPAYAVLPK